MATLIEFQRRLQILDSQVSLDFLLFKEIERFKNIFIRLNKEQLSKGEDNEGDIFGEYTQATQEIAALGNPRKPKIAGQPYNFEDTGGLFDGFEMIIENSTAQFWSTDSKTPELIVEYQGLFGLNPDNLQKVISTVILPAFLLSIRRELQLT